MSSKADDEPAVSLFSFQDIITSITGIMFLVVLLLVLMIFDSREAPENKENPDEAKAIQTEIKALRKRLAELAEWDDSLESKISEMASMNPEALERKMAEVMRETASEHEKLTKARALNSELTAKLNSLNESIEKMRERLSGMENESAREKTLFDMRKKRAELERILSVREKAVRYTIDRSSAKTPVLAECGSDGIRVLRPSDGAIFDFRNKSFSASAALFLEWTEKNVARSNTYIILMVKPAVFKESAALRELLKRKNFDRGIEILPTDASTVFPDVETKKEGASNGKK